MVDRLSDRGFLSFTDDLKIIVRKGSHSPSLAELLAEIEGNQAKAATLLPELKNTVIRDQLESNAVDLIRRRICFKRTRLHFLGVSDRCGIWTCPYFSVSDWAKTSLTQSDLTSLSNPWCSQVTLESFIVTFDQRGLQTLRGETNQTRALVERRQPASRAVVETYSGQRSAKIRDSKPLSIICSSRGSEGCENNSVRNKQ